MEKIPNQEYRDELASKLTEIRNSDSDNPELAKAKAQGYLDAKKESEEYQKAKDDHQEIYLKEATEELEKVELPFEFGPELGKGSWFNAEKKVKELNKALKPGEKPWRLPSTNEWKDILAPILEIQNSDSVPTQEKNKILKSIRNKYDLQDNFYWSSDSNEGPSVRATYGTAYFVDLTDYRYEKYSCFNGNGNKDLGFYSIRCIR